MNIPLILQGLAPATLLAALLCTGCSAEARKSRALGRAEQFAQSQEFEKAKIEYLNALKADPEEPAAYRGLGEAWARQGAPLQALPLLHRAAELDPADAASRLQLAALFAALGQPAEGFAHAQDVLEKAPGHLRALNLLADCARTSEQWSQVESHLSSVPPEAGAERLLASSKLHRARGRETESLADLREALRLQPRLAEAHQLMGNRHLQDGRLEEAASSYAAAARHSPPRSVQRLYLAEFHAQRGQRDQAREVLEGLLREAPDYLPALRLLAQHWLAQGDPDTALDLTSRVLRIDPRNIEALLLQADIWRAQGKAEQALQRLEQLVRGFPQSPDLHFHHGRGLVSERRFDDAAAAFRRTMELQPDHVQARIALADSLLRRGEAAEAGRILDEAAARPNLKLPPTLRAEAALAAGEPQRAVELLREELQGTASDAGLWLRIALILRASGDSAGTLDALGQARALAPVDLAIAYQVIDLHLAENRPQEALEAADKAVAEQPENAGAHFLLGRVHVAAQRWAEAEAVLKRSLALDPSSFSACRYLAGVYSATGRVDEAVRELEAAAARSPENPQPLLLLAVLHDQQQQHEQARACYEKLAALLPDSPVVLNNLAFSHAEHGGDLQRGEETARRARALRPSVSGAADATRRAEAAAIADTLGWILYRQGKFPEALALLEEAAPLLGDSPEAQWHLGMAAHTMARDELASAALQRAAESDAAVAADARAQLALRARLQDAASRPAELEKLASEHPADPRIQLALAEHMATTADPRQAAEAATRAHELNAALPQPLLLLAELHEGPLQDPQKALDYANRAREVAPRSPQVLLTLGRLALQTGDDDWALSLLQDASRLSGAPAEVSFHLGRACYLNGRLADARHAFEAASSDRTLPSATRELSQLHLTYLRTPANEDMATETLRQHPQFVPALMVRAEALSGAGKNPEAVEMLDGLLRRHQHFAPAQKALGRLLADDPKQLQRAYQLSRDAREAYPDDPQVAATLGELSYRLGDPAYARQLLEESILHSEPSARILHFLGRTLCDLDDPSAGARHLQRAIEGGLPEPWLSEAQQVLVGLEKKAADEAAAPAGQTAE